MLESHTEPDYVDEDQLRELGIDPALVRILCPWAIELTGHDGRRCWASADLVPPTQGGRP